MSKTQHQLQKFGVRPLVPPLGSVTRVTMPELASFSTHRQILLPESPTFLFLSVQGGILLLGVRLSASSPLHPCPHFALCSKGSRSLSSLLCPRSHRALPIPAAGCSHILQFVTTFFPTKGLPCLPPCLSAGTARPDQGKPAKARGAPSLFPGCEEE